MSGLDCETGDDENESISRRIMTAPGPECHEVTGHHIEYHHHHLARIKLNYPPPEPDRSNFQGVTWLSDGALLPQ